MDKKTLCLYHGGCADGFCAAWCAWRLHGDAAEYQAVFHGQPPPDVTDRHVLILDFSYKRAALLEMHAKAASLRVLDHHVTAQKDLEGLDFCTFDMNRSGAGLAWDYLVSKPREFAPLVDYVEDRDLWRKALPDSEEISAAIGTYNFDFNTWSQLNDMLRGPTGIALVVSEGRAVLRHIDRYVRQMAEQARRVNFLGHPDIPVANAPFINISDLVGHLAETAPFAVGWFQRGDGLYQYSLRSRGDFDVSELAKSMGGGGHAKAAGFTCPVRVEGPYHLFRNSEGHISARDLDHCWHIFTRDVYSDTTREEEEDCDPFVQLRDDAQVEFGSEEPTGEPGETERHGLWYQTKPAKEWAARWAGLSAGFV